MNYFKMKEAWSSLPEEGAFGSSEKKWVIKCQSQEQMRHTLAEQRNMASLVSHVENTYWKDQLPITICELCKWFPKAGPKKGKLKAQIYKGHHTFTHSREPKLSRKCSI